MSEIYYSDDPVTLFHGDCIEVMRELPDESVHAVVTDPPYGLEFMGREWDGADGFRRSLNAADAGRDSVFGRTSRTSPEYKTESRAKAGMQKGGISPADGRPSFLGGLNPKCLSCGKWQRGSNPCTCDSPEFTNERLPRLHAFQEWTEVWASECLRILKPGGHLLAFGGSRTWHRLAAGIEDAGFEIRDSIAWLYGSGFPKSLDVSKAIDKAAGVERAPIGEKRLVQDHNLPGTGAIFRASSELGNATKEYQDTVPATDAAREWEGWGTALKPSFEPIVVARKPLSGTVAQTVLAYGTGALNIDATRVGDEPREVMRSSGEVLSGNGSMAGPNTGRIATGRIATGRWPSNVVLDESQAAELDRQSGVSESRIGKPRGAASGEGWGMTATGAEYADAGGASRFFPTFRYEAKAPTSERPKAGEVQHPTVKPLELMQWLIRLVTPPDGIVLEPFAGSGTTLEACLREGFSCIGIEREADYLPLIMSRLQKPIEQTLFGGAA